MRFLSHSEEDIGGVENSNEFQIIRPCKFITWPWHSDKHGCCIVYDKIKGDYWHIYLDQNIVLDMSGKPIADLIYQIFEHYDYSIRNYFRQAFDRTATIGGSGGGSGGDAIHVDLHYNQECLTKDLVQRNERGETIYITENTEACIPCTRFGVNIGKDLLSTCGAFDTNVHGLTECYRYMHILTTTYIHEILPQLNQNIDVAKILSNKEEQQNNVILNHLLPEQLFDVIVQYGVGSGGGGGGGLLFLRPCSIVQNWAVFLNGWRNQLFGVVRSLASGSADDVKQLISIQDKLREKKLCSAATFTSVRSIIPEFRCSAKSAEECPHIQNAINVHKQLVLKQDIVLCNFLLSAYLEKYDDATVNTMFQFKCQFPLSLPPKNDPRGHNYNREIDYSHQNISVFQGLFGRQTNLHRMCLPAQYLTIDWFRWTLKLMNIRLDNN